MVTDYINTITEFSNALSTGINDYTDNQHKTLADLFDKLVTFVSSELTFDDPDYRTMLIDSLKNILKPALSMYKSYLMGREDSLRTEYNNMISQIDTQIQESTENVNDNVVSIEQGKQRVYKRGL